MIYVVESVLKIEKQLAFEVSGHLAENGFSIVLGFKFNTNPTINPDLTLCSFKFPIFWLFMNIYALNFRERLPKLRRVYNEPYVERESTKLRLRTLEFLRTFFS